MRRPVRHGPVRTAVLLSGLLALGACGAVRLPDTACGTGAHFGNDRIEVSQASQSVGAPALATLAAPADVDARVTDALRSEAREVPGAGPITIDVLALSAGGQYGAFGAGFLRGWGARRPEFTLITGVSAGALIAPSIHAGERFDPLLDSWNGLDKDGVFALRFPLTWLSSPSIASTDPLARTVGGAINDDVIAAIADRDRAGARLFVSAVDLDKSRAQVFDLGALARDDTLSTARKRACMTEMLLASAAIPILMPPRQIDGVPYADGGLRDQVFLVTLDQARIRIERETGRQVRVRATLVVNGALDPPAGDVDASLLGFGSRSVQILADEVLRDSVRDVIAFTEARPDWSLQAMVAPVEMSPNCDSTGKSTPQFDACVTASLFAAGLREGRAPVINWLDASGLRDRLGAFSAADL